MNCPTCRNPIKGKVNPGSYSCSGCGASVTVNPSYELSKAETAIRSLMLDLMELSRKQRDVDDQIYAKLADLEKAVLRDMGLDRLQRVIPSILDQIGLWQDGMDMNNVGTQFSDRRFLDLLNVVNETNHIYLAGGINGESFLQKL